MAWTVSTAKETRGDGSLVIKLIYTDGARNISEIYDAQGNIDDNYLAIKAKSKIAFLEAQDASYASVSVGALTPKDPPAIVPPILTQAEIDRNKFLKDYDTAQKAKRAVLAGLLNESDQQFIDIQNTVKASFKLEYLDYI